MKLFKSALLVFAVAALSSCSDKDDVITYNVDVKNQLPEVVANYDVVSAVATFEEVNTGAKKVVDLTDGAELRLPVGIYNIAGEMLVANGEIEQHLKASLYQYSLTGDADLTLDWMIFNPKNSLIFSEVFITGSLNAKGTNGLYDTYFLIYNNTGEVQYADGLAICESKLLNTSSDEILTEANQRNNNFTVQTVYVIPGSGKDVAIQPGQSIKIVDQAIDWNEQVAGALNHTDADFEWYDESTSASVKDTDNPEVPNLDKWYSYSATIWLPSNQCNRSYALVRFPEGTTMESFLTEQIGDYEYINSATGNTMKGTKCYLVKPEWILDGVNFCPTEKFTTPVLPATIDRGYAAISEKNSDVNRFGKKFARKQSGVGAAGNIILQDTDNSADDFEVLPVK